MALAAVLTLGATLAPAQTAQPTQDQNEPAWRRLAGRLRPQQGGETMPTPPPPPDANPLPTPPEVGPPAAPPPTGVAPVTVTPPSGEMILPDSGTIGLPSAGIGTRGRVQINLGSEADERTTKTLDLFQDPSVMRMLGETPRFVYDAADRPDPMIFPPVRNAAIFAELSLRAEKLMEENKLVDAVVLYDRIVKLEDPRYLAQARDKRAAIMAMIEESQRPADIVLEMPVEVVIELPAWVSENTKGVIAGDGGSASICLVGDSLLKAGDVVPSYPNVRVVEITKEKVVYEISDQRFEVKVKGNDHE
jgi:hypothetical protein